MKILSYCFVSQYSNYKYSKKKLLFRRLKLHLQGILYTMTYAKPIFESIDLNLDTDFLEIATVSLIREYLARKVRNCFI